MKDNFILDKHVLLQFATGLRERRGQLKHHIQNAGTEVRELADSGPCDTIDVSCFSSSKESIFAHSSQNRRQLRLVELALERIRDGSFGICAGCDGLIGLKRLQAIPWANHCIECQRLSEYGGLGAVPLPAETGGTRSTANG